MDSEISKLEEQSATSRERLRDEAASLQTQAKRIDRNLVKLCALYRREIALASRRKETADV